MTDPNLLTSLPAAVILALVLRGLMPFWTLHEGKEDLYHFARGLGWIIGVFLLRTLYWGTVRGVVVAIDPSLWGAWSAWVNGPDWINGFFNLGLILGGWHVLRAFHAMIPASERHRWGPFSAPFYPRGWCFASIVDRLLRSWPVRRD